VLARPSSPRLPKQELYHVFLHPVGSIFIVEVELEPRDGRVCLFFVFTSSFLPRPAFRSLVRDLNGIFRIVNCVSSLPLSPYKYPPRLPFLFLFLRNNSGLPSTRLDRRLIYTILTLSSCHLSLTPRRLGVLQSRNSI